MNMRTPLSRVRGLGSARSGTDHFWRQRLTAVSNIPLFSLKAHPISFLRKTLHQRHFVQNAYLRELPSGRTVTVAGLVLVRQRPGSAKGVIFETIEDETGVANIIV